MQAYFDNSATTKPCPEAVEAVNLALTETWGNPSSLHKLGVDAEKLLEQSRQTVAQSLSCNPEEIYFVSGGTEGNNLAVTGGARLMKRKGNRIVSTAVEHPSVDEVLSKLSDEGFEVVKIGVDSYGRVKEEDLYEAVNSDTVLVTMMYVNNEVGSVMPVRTIKSALKRAKSDALIHIDAVQAYGKLKINPAQLGADLVTLSSHKIHGPKGVGALYIRKGVRIKPLVYGGEQEMKMRPGTQALPLIAGFAAAVNAIPDYKKSLEEATALRDYMLEKFSETGSIEVNSAPDALPYVTNISVPGIKSEPMLNYLSSNGIYVSSGSACSRGKKSRVLTEMKLPDARLETPLRISFSRYTTKEEIDYLAEMLEKGSKEIRKTGNKNL